MSAPHETPQQSGESSKADLRQLLIIIFLGVAMCSAVAFNCYAAFAGKPTDTGTTQFAGVIAGGFIMFLRPNNHQPPTQ